MVVVSHLFFFLRKYFRGRCDSGESHRPLSGTIYFPTAPYFAGTAIILVLTVLFNAGIETAVGAVMGVGPKWVIFLTNVGTNLVMNIILGYLDFTFRLYVRGYYFPVMCVFEILVLAAEYRIYLRFMGRRFPKKSILKYTAAANAVSFLLGLLALQLLGMGVF